MAYAKNLKLFAVAAALFVSACDSTNQGIDRMGSASDRLDARAEASFDAFRNADAQRGGGAQVTDGVFVAPIKERNNASALLPSRVQAPNAVTLASKDALNVQQVAERLTAITGIEHVVSLGPPGGTAGNSGSPAASKLLLPNYSGKLSEVLAKISSGYGVEWTYSEGKVILRDYVTRQYQIPVIPSVATGGSSVGGSTSGYTADFWSEFEKSVDGILDEDVVYNISKTTGLLTVTAQVDNHAEIKDFVDEISKNMTQQIAFDVNVISVTLDEAKGFGLDLDVAVKNLNGNASNSLGYTAAGTLNDNVGGANLTIVHGDVSVTAMAKALATQGKVSVDTRTGVTTVNNRPVPVEVVDAVSYVASIQTETDKETGNTRYIPQPLTQDIGFTLQLYPRIMNTNDIMVEYSLSLSELKALKTFGEGQNQIQLPEVSNTNFSQQTVLQNGQTLILSGFERTRTTYDKSTSAGLLGFGGSKRADNERVATVVMIRPQILASQRSIRSGRN